MISNRPHGENSLSGPDIDLNDPLVFKRVVLECSRLIRSVIAKTLIRHGQSAEQDVDDVAQEVLIRVWRFRHSYRPQDGKFSTWIGQIAKNAAYDYLRKKRRMPQAEDEAILENRVTESADPLEDIIAIELSHTVAALIEEMLPPSLRQSFKDDMAGLSPEEQMSARGIARMTVYSRRQKAREALALALPEDFLPPPRRK